MKKDGQSWIEKNLPIIKVKLKEFGESVVSATKEIWRLLKIVYHKAKPHVISSCRKIGPACKKAYQKIKPHVKKAYCNVKEKVRESKSTRPMKGKMHHERSHENEVTYNRKIMPKISVSKLIKPTLVVVGIIIVLWVLLSLLGGDGTPENAVKYKFPEERTFSYPEQTPVDCPVGMDDECSKGFFEPANVGCPISCDDDDPCTQDSCNSEYECVNTDISGCTR